MKLLLSISLACFLMTNIYAAESDKNIPIIQKNLVKIIPSIKEENISASPIEGMYQIDLDGQLVFTTKDGAYIFDGAVFNVDKRIDLVAEHRRENTKVQIANLAEEDMVIFSPEKGKIEHSIYVFTDVDCGYCRKLHSEMQSYLDAGIEVRYLAYPRAGLQSDSFQKAVNIWCAEDTQTAMTESKGGKNLPNLDCENPIQAQYELGGKIGVNGTPAIVSETGTLIPGYRPAANLSQVLTQLKNTDAES